MNGRYYIGRIILTILLAFSVAGYIGLSAAGTLFNEDIYIDIINEEDLAGKAQTALQKDFQAEYNTTMIPPEVYMDAITPEWTVKTMCETAQTAVAYITNGDLAYETDYTALEESITAYFHEYAESIDYEPDEVFEEKLAETIKNAEAKIDSRLDAFYMQTLAENDILLKVHKYYPVLEIGVWALAGISVLLAAVLVLLDRNNGWRRLYFSGTGLFAGGALMTIPAAYLLFSDIISSFSIKDPVIYPAITGVMETAAHYLFTKAVFFAAMGLVLIGVTVAFNRKKTTEE
jgi:hypothetical protein